MTRKASDSWRTRATRETWTRADTAALLAEGGALLSPMASNAKTRKQLKKLGIHGAILYMAPADGAAAYYHRAFTVCPLAGLNRCADPCLNWAGRGQILRERDPIEHPVHRARIRRTLRYMADRRGFMAQLRAELSALASSADRRGLKAVARLDGTSDLGLALILAPEFPSIQFYDYSKVPARTLRHLRNPAPNYHVTFSRGAGNDADAAAILAAGGNVAAVFDTPKGETLPAEFLGAPVIDGDEHDFRYLDPRGGFVIGLHAKGRARHDASGFVVHAADLEALKAA